MTETLNNSLKCSEKLCTLIRDLENFQDKQIFFLGGFVKSGTTWIERLLDAHPEVACKGEAHFCSLLEPSLQLAISKYNSVIPKKGNWERLNNEGIQQFQAPDYSYTGQDFNYISALSIQLLMSKWSDDSKIKSVGEKTPNNAQYFQRLLQLFPSAKFVYIVRDIRDVIVSGWFFNLAIDSEYTLRTFESIHKYGISMAQNWVQAVSNGLKFAEQNNTQVHIIKYEDLWHEPVNGTSKLLQFLSVDDSSEVIKFCLRTTDFSKLSDGRKRGIENRGSFYRKGIIGDWKNHLKHDTLLEIETYCGAMLDHLGYPQYQA